MLKNLFYLPIFLFGVFWVGPDDENTEILAERDKKLDGPIEVILKHTAQ